MKLADFGKFLADHNGSQFFRRNTDPDTSHEAAEKLNLTQLEDTVLSAIQQFPNGCISDDVLKTLPAWGIETITPRYAALLRKGHIIDTGERRRAASGRSQRVMKAV
jgi:hypothetical protein